MEKIKYIIMLKNNDNHNSNAIGFDGFDSSTLKIFK
jgi:hypothetical protein